MQVRQSSIFASDVYWLNTAGEDMQSSTAVPTTSDGGPTTAISCFLFFNISTCEVSESIVWEVTCGWLYFGSRLKKQKQVHGVNTKGTWVTAFGKRTIYGDQTVTHTSIVFTAEIIVVGCFQVYTHCEWDFESSFCSDLPDDDDDGNSIELLLHMLVAMGTRLSSTYTYMGNGLCLWYT